MTSSYYQSPLTTTEVAVCRNLWALVGRAEAQFPKSTMIVAQVAKVRLSVFYQWRAAAILLAAERGEDINATAKDPEPSARTLARATAGAISVWLKVRRDRGDFPHESAGRSAPGDDDVGDGVNDAERAVDRWIATTALPRLQHLHRKRRLRFFNPRPVDEFFVREMQARLHPFPAPAARGARRGGSLRKRRRVGNNNELEEPPNVFIAQVAQSNTLLTEAFANAVADVDLAALSHQNDEEVRDWLMKVLTEEILGWARGELNNKLLDQDDRNADLAAVTSQLDQINTDIKRLQEELAVKTKAQTDALNTQTKLETKLKELDDSLKKINETTEALLLRHQTPLPAQKNRAIAEMFRTLANQIPGYLGNRVESLVQRLEKKDSDLSQDDHEEIKGHLDALNTKLTERKVQVSAELQAYTDLSYQLRDDIQTLSQATSQLYASVWSDVENKYQGQVRQTEAAYNAEIQGLRTNNTLLEHKRDVLIAEKERLEKEKTRIETEREAERARHIEEKSLLKTKANEEINFHSGLRVEQAEKWKAKMREKEQEAVTLRERHAEQERDFSAEKTRLAEQWAEKERETGNNWSLRMEVLEQRWSEKERELLVEIAQKKAEISSVEQELLDARSAAEELLREKAKEHADAITKLQEEFSKKMREFEDHEQHLRMTITKIRDEKNDLERERGEAIDKLLQTERKIMMDPLNIKIFDDLKKSIYSLKQRNEEKDRELVKLKNELKSTFTELHAVNQSLNKTTNKLTNTELKLTTTNDNNQSMKKAIAKNEKERTKLEQERDKLTTRVSLLEKNLNILQNQENTTQKALREAIEKANTESDDYFAKKNRLEEQMTTFEMLNSELEETKRLLREKRAELNDQKNEVDNLSSKMDDLLEENEKEIHVLTETITEKENALAVLQTRFRNLQDEAESLRASLGEEKKQHEKAKLKLSSDLITARRHIAMLTEANETIAQNESQIATLRAIIESEAEIAIRMKRNIEELERALEQGNAKATAIRLQNVFAMNTFRTQKDKIQALQNTVHQFQVAITELHAVIARGADELDTERRTSAQLRNQLQELQTARQTEAETIDKRSLLDTLRRSIFASSRKRKIEAPPSPPVAATTTAATATSPESKLANDIAIGWLAHWKEPAESPFDDDFFFSDHEGKSRLRGVPLQRPHGSEYDFTMMLNDMIRFSQLSYAARERHLMHLRMHMKVMDLNVFRNEHRIEQLASVSANDDEKLFLRIYAVMFVRNFWTNKVRRLVARARHFFSRMATATTRRLRRLR